MEGRGAESFLRRWAIVAIVALGLLAGWRYGGNLQLASLSQHEQALRQWRSDAPIAVFGAAFVIYVAVTGLSLPFATGLSLAYGWYFGFLPGVILVSFASTSGATLAFFSSRFLLRDFVERRWGDALRRYERQWAADGAYYLFTLRLIPAVPFFVVNLLSGLTPMRWQTFWWVSQVGMLPATIVYLYAGSTVPTLQQLSERGVAQIVSPRVLGAFAALAFFPYVVRWLFAKLQPRDVPH